MSSGFDEKISQLQNEVGVLDNKLSIDNKFKNIYLMVAAFFPFITFAFLYFTSFGFVMQDDEVDRKKVLKWTLIFSALVWLCLYFLSTIKPKPTQ
jgi:hypothetical protein